MVRFQQSGDGPSPSPSPSHSPSPSPSPSPLPRGTEHMIVVLSAIMSLLAGLLLIQDLLRRLSGGATTHPAVRFFLWVVSGLLLLLTSFFFSLETPSNEPLRSKLIMLWMLLAELLRKKLGGVNTINDSPLQGVNKQSTWDVVDQLVRIAWIGCLICIFVRNRILITLWVFSSIKVAQRVAAIEVAKRSFALGKNPHLIAGYMRQLFRAEEQDEQEETAATGGEEESENATTVMMACKYVIMGEDKAKRKAGPQGYSLQLSDAKERDKMVTVGDVWRLAVSGGDALFASVSLKLKDLCLSFALYKLQRRRYNKYPSAEAGSRKALDFLLRGLLGDDEEISPRDRRSVEERKGERVFRVIEDELSFLSDYHFSTIRVTLPNIWFFLLNCVLTLIMIFFGIVMERDAIFSDLVDQVKKKVTPPNMYDLIITLLLIATFFLLEVAEAIVYVLSEWVMISLLCSYAKKPSWRRSTSVLRGLTMLRRLKTSLKRPELKFNQHSVLEPRGRTLRIFSQLGLGRSFLHVQSMLSKLMLYRRFLGMQSKPVPKEVKAAIVKYLIDSGGRPPVLHIGESVLRRNGATGEELLRACKSNGSAEMIIIWHIATCLYEMKYPSPPSPLPQQQPQQLAEPDSQVNCRIAETLSKYCAYLVALAPKLLPDDAVATATAYKAAVKDIQDAILKGRDRKADDFKSVTRIRKVNGTVAERGAELGHQLVEVVERGAQLGHLLVEAAERGTQLGHQLVESAERRVELGHQLVEAAERGAVLGHQLVEATERGAEPGHELWGEVAERGAELGHLMEAAAERGAELGRQLEEAAAERGAELGRQLEEAAAERGAELGRQLDEEAVERGTELGRQLKLAAERGAELGHRLVEAAERGAELGHLLVESAERGAELGHLLVESARDERWVWKVLAELWTEIMVYVAPSDDVKSHAQALAHGGEFITHIWALLSHGGILQWPAAAPPPADQSPAADDSAPRPADQSISRVMSLAK